MTEVVEQPAPTLSDEQLAEVLELLDGADSVELKVSVPDADRRSAVAALGMDPLDAQIRQVAFFDTPDLLLSRHGVVVRVRRVQGKAGDAVVKLRPLDPHQLREEVRRTPDLGVEVDAMPGAFVCSGSMRAEVDADAAREVLSGRRRLSKVLGKTLRSMFADHAPAGLQLDDLSMLGPINLLKLKFRPAGFARRLVAELWIYPDGSRILELSTKCSPAEAFEAAAETKALLAGVGINLLSEQQTKTETALRHFARQLDSPADTRRSGGAR